LDVKQDGIYLNNELTNSYTFKYNYFWMMGDNRHNSQDSRFWGFVPEDHIVGKAVLVWFSWDSKADGLLNKIRWNRVMTVIHGDGKSTSLLPFFLLIVAFFVGKKQYKKYKAKKAA
jgi:signal peptidase I